MKPILSAALAAMLCAASASAGTPPQLSEPVYSTHVDSTVEIGPDGRVQRYEPLTELAGPLAGHVRGLAEGLRFEPVKVDGREVVARARMRMHLRAEAEGEGDLRVTLERVSFPATAKETADGVEADADRAYIRGVSRRGPVSYPEAALRAQAMGRVLVALRVGPDGQVIDAVPRESALYRAGGPARAQAGALAALEDAAAKALRSWRFDVRVPEGAQPGPEDLTGLIIVDYTLDDFRVPGPGVWMRERRSAQRPIPWLDPMLAERLPRMGDVGQGGHFGAAASRFRLLDPPGDAAL